MATSPVITRTYGPEAFGVLGAFTALLAVIVPFGALSYPTAIVLARSDVEAIGLAKLSLRIGVAVSLAVGGITLACRNQISSLLNLGAAGDYLLLLPWALYFSVCLAVLSQWVIRKKLFQVQAKVSVLQSLWLNGTKVVLGFVAPTAAVLVALAASGSAVHAVMLLIGARRNTAASVLFKTGSVSGGGRRFLALAIRHKDFAIYHTPQLFINAASQSMPVLLLSSFFGAAYAGFYSVAIFVLGMPAQLLGKSVADVFYPRISEAANNQENLVKPYLKASMALIAVGVLPFGFVIVTGPWLFGMVFGAEWVVAGEYARWLSLWLYTTFFTTTAASLLPVIGGQRFNLMFTVVKIASRVTGLLLGVFWFQDDTVAIMLYSIFGALLNIYFLLAVLRMVIEYSRQAGGGSSKG